MQIKVIEGWLKVVCVITWFPRLFLAVRHRGDRPKATPAAGVPTDNILPSGYFTLCKYPIFFSFLFSLKRAWNSTFPIGKRPAEWSELFCENFGWIYNEFEIHEGLLSRKAVSETHRLFFQTIQTRHVDFFISLSFFACSRIRLQLRVHFEILNLMPSIAENNNGLSCRLERATSRARLWVMECKKALFVAAANARFLGCLQLGRVQATLEPKFCRARYVVGLGC